MNRRKCQVKDIDELKFPMDQKSQLLITWNQYSLTMLTSPSTMKKSEYETQEHELDLSKQRTDIFPWLAPGICKYF